jgi:hypothetical protein
MTRALAFILLTILELGLCIFAALAPALFIGPVYLCELGLDRLRPEWIDPRTDLREYYPVST